MWSVVAKVAANVGVSFEYIVLIIAIIGLLTFFAVDFRLGVVMGFVLTAGIFMWFYAAKLNWVPAVVCMFIFLVVLALTLYFVGQKSATGGLI